MIKNKYPDSSFWISKIPQKWGKERLKFLISSFGSGGTPTAGNEDFYSENGFPFVNISDMSNSSLILNTKKRLTNKGIQDKKLKKYPEGTILYAIYASVGKVSELGLSATISQAFLAFEINSTVENKEYLKYCLASFEPFCLFLSNGTTQNNLSADSVLNIYLPVPPLEVQNKIAKFLVDKISKIESLISNEQRQIEKLKAYKQSLISEIVTKGLDPNVSMKDSGVEWIGKIPEGWEVKRFKYISSNLVKGNGISKDDIDLNGDTKCIRYGEIYSVYNKYFFDTTTRTNLKNNPNSCYVSFGNLLFSLTGELIDEIGKSIVYLGKDKLLAGGDILVSKHSQNPLFLGFAMDSLYVQKQKSLGKFKLKVVHIHKNDIGNLLVAIPDIKSQTEIGNKCKSINDIVDKIIILKNKKINNLIFYKQSLIYEYVTGKKEVK